MAARIALYGGLVCAVCALAAGPRPLQAQQSTHTDSVSSRGYPGQPFRMDALTPWRRGGAARPQLHRAPEPDGDAVAAAPERPQRPFRLRSRALPAAVYGRERSEAAKGVYGRERGSVREAGIISALSDLLVPVLGIARSDVRNDFGARRVGHRHQGVDIPAPGGTPVVAVVDGQVVKMKWDVGGGRTLRLLDRTGKYLFYYAHLSGYARGLREGQDVRQGQVLGFVGRTGSVIGSGSHLHLGISSLLADADRWWLARPVNPYRYLQRAFGFGCDTAGPDGWSCSTNESAGGAGSSAD